jgi:hypothetical protein
MASRNERRDATVLQSSGAEAYDGHGRRGNSVTITGGARRSLTLPGPDRAYVGERTTPPNKELKLTKPSQNGASQLNSSVRPHVQAVWRPEELSERQNDKHNYGSSAS